jgi:predicted ester cyclase
MRSIALLTFLARPGAASSRESQIGVTEPDLTDNLADGILGFHRYLNNYKKERLMNLAEITRKIYIAIESGDMATAASFLADDFVLSGPVPDPIGGEQWLGLQGLLLTAFPDWSFNLSDVQVTGNVARTTHQISGTHTGDLDLSPLGMPVIPATGKKVRLPVEHADLTFEGGKAVRLHADVPADGGVPGIMQQLGVQMPTP